MAAMLPRPDEYNFGDSEFLMLLLVMITLPFAANRDGGLPRDDRRAARHFPGPRARTDRQVLIAPHHVVGDVMLDRFLIGRVSRMSPEAPVPVVVFDHEEIRLGGAANVANNLRELGGAVDLIGVIGSDEAGSAAEKRAGGDGHSTQLGSSPIRSGGTTTKMRVVTSRNQQVSRIDFESDHEVGEAVEAAIASQVEMRARSAQVVIVSDYQKGVVTRRSMAHLVSFAHANGVPVIVDPKVPHIDFYAGAALVTPNHIEAESATNSRITTHEDARRASAELRKRLGVESVLITRGEHGMWLDHAGADGYLPTSAREVSDVTGAGDTVIATLALAIAAGSHDD
jgi:D-beta-D-heptose 7-phosphate kinase/D-beta-D-heptose 1-phosphate adenosyltransferase